MSVAAKTFFAGAILISATTVWGVHYLQKWEYNNMYQGILKDEARLAAKATAAAVQQSKIVTQPAPLIDSECQTCIVSSPPQLLESQSAEQRAQERESRKKEYEEQKLLAGRLANEQGGVRQ
ncbi:uncharacterized protein L203_104214 [Cryptococcus depauperatus CBS 7841]|uniref:Uncharacterized protein n=1 Tax=Cryptococcus depauperatus CBS 7841 TaxID=1295531 RepID=A0A1E3I7K0_9TREE|nr:hypothetical protein L203_05216 [Cryptococcus depauperatus CBS 7841]ODN96845.1 hypothetical protein L204_03554 [Cryptococcus depauperatus CBS 7855]